VSREPTLLRDADSGSCPTAAGRFPAVSTTSSALSRGTGGALS
jgi:hypothetical protein